MRAQYKQSGRRMDAAARLRVRAYSNPAYIEVKHTHMCTYINVMYIHINCNYPQLYCTFSLEFLYTFYRVVASVAQLPHITTMRRRRRHAANAYMRPPTRYSVIRESMYSIHIYIYVIVYTLYCANKQ